jgi:acyl-CoA reductase-like NAD-dependent aldehyde dehydrogenase
LRPAAVAAILDGGPRAPEVEMDRSAVRELVAGQRAFFASGRTRGLDFRREQLQALRALVVGEEPRLVEALRADLGKPAFEAYAGEVALVRREVDHVLRHLSSWARTRRVPTILAHFPARTEVRQEPRGVVLVISPWNFPVQLSLVPIVGALAAGNVAILKLPPAVRATSALLAELLRRDFDPGCLAPVEGGVEVAEALLDERLDYVFFTGGPAAGRKVMAAAARHLTPVTLELGGKNPCIVDADVDLEVAARRIAWGKFFNTGQSCVAVDYLLVDRRVKAALVERIAACVREFYGDDPRRSPDYGRVIDAGHFDRMMAHLRGRPVLLGGEADPAARYIPPTIVDGVPPGDLLMEEEIFGPILPVISYGDVSEALATVAGLPPPLALYVFSRDRRFQERVLGETRAGGGCVNDTTIHFTSSHLPFGGAGESGIGAYHGKASFDLFSHRRGLVRRGFALDVKLRYPPYAGKLRWFRRIF